MGAGKPTSINNLVSNLIEFSGRPNIKLIYKAPRKGDLRNSYADISKAKKMLGYKPRIKLQKGKRKLLHNSTFHSIRYNSSSLRAHGRGKNEKFYFDQKDYGLATNTSYVEGLTGTHRWIESMVKKGESIEVEEKTCCFICHT